MAVNLSETREFYRQFKSQLTAEVVAGSDKQLQYNNNGVLGASNNLVFDYTNSVLVVHRESSSLGATTTLALKNEDLTDGISVGLDFQAFDSNSTLRTAARIASIIDSHDVGSVTSRLVFGTGSNQHMTINSTGNVGIGESNPTRNLTVSSPTNAVISVQNSVQSTEGVLNAPEGGTINVGTTGLYDLQLSTNNIERMRIDSIGNVGIEATPDIYTDSQHRTLRIGKSLTMMSKEAASVSVPSYIRNNIDFIRINGSAANTYISADGYPAEQITLYQGELVFFNAPAGIGGDSTSLTTGKNYIIVEAPTSPTNEFSANFGAGADTEGTLFTSTATGTAASGLVRENATLTERFKIDSNGQIDIVTNVGSNDSAAGLSIHNTSTIQVGAPVDDNYYGGGIRFYFTDSSGTDDKLSAAIIARKKNNWSSAVATNKDADIEFHTLDNDVLGRRMVITPNGSVWMGDDSTEMPNFVTTNDQTAGDVFGRLVVGKNSSHTTGAVGGADMHINVWNGITSNIVDKGSFLGFSDNYFADPNWVNVTRAAIKGATEVIGNNASGYMSFYTSGATANNLTEKMRITSAGNVGIGEDNPIVKLSVRDYSTNTTPTNFIRPAANAGIRISNEQSETGSFAGLSLISRNTGSVTQSVDLLSVSNGSGNTPDFVITQQLLTSDQTDASREVFRITSDVNFGIGKSTLSDWSSVFGNIIQMNTPNNGSNAIASADVDNFRIMNNVYLEENGAGGNWKYYATGAAATYQMDAGTHYWYSLPSGNAGDAASFTEVLRIDRLDMQRTVLPGGSNRTIINNDSGGGFASSYVDIYDKNIVLSTPTIATAQLSPINISADDAWYVIFEGYWQNTVEGTGFTTYSTIRHVSSDDPTFRVGGVTVTIQRNTGDGTLELYKNSISYVQFVGKVTVILENGSPLPDHSMILSRNLRVGSTSKPSSTIISIEGNSSNTAIASEGGSTLELRNSNSTVDTFSSVEFFGEASNGDNTTQAQVRGAKSTDHTTYTSGYLAFDTVDTGGTMNEVMRVTADEKVGIGITEPQSTLEVVNSFAIQAVNDNTVKRSFVKNVQGTGVTNVLQISIPAQNVFVFIKLKFAGSRALTASTDQGTSTVGEYYYAIARNGSGSDVVLDNNVGSQNWSSGTTSAGGVQDTQTSPATTIVRNGSEANTAAQVVNITLDVQIVGGSTGNYLCDFDILMSENGAGGNITLL